MKKSFHLITMLALVAVLGLASCNKEEDRVATGYTISGLELTKIPNNTTWDVGGSPDIFFKIMNSDKTTLYYTSSTKDDVNSLPVSWSNINCPLNVGETYIISFFDEDLLENEIMVNCQLKLSAYDAPYAGYTSTYEWEASNGTISFNLNLNWKFR